MNSKTFETLSSFISDDIIFQVDGENTTAILNGQYNTIRNAAGLPPNADYIYADGSMLAPFDKEVIKNFIFLDGMISLKYMETF